MTKCHTGVQNQTLHKLKKKKKAYIEKEDRKKTEVVNGSMF